MFIATIMSLYNYKCSVFFSEKTHTTYKYLEQTAHKDKVYKKHSTTPVIISKLSEWCVYVEREIYVNFLSKHKSNVLHKLVCACKAFQYIYPCDKYPFVGNMYDD